MFQVLVRCQVSKADDAVNYFEAFATQQMQINWRTRTKWIKTKNS